MKKDSKVHFAEFILPASRFYDDVLKPGTVNDLLNFHVPGEITDRTLFWKIQKKLTAARIIHPLLDIVPARINPLYNAPLKFSLQAMDCCLGVRQKDVKPVEMVSSLPHELCKKGFMDYALSISLPHVARVIDAGIRQSQVLECRVG